MVGPPNNEKINFLAPPLSPWHSLCLVLLVSLQAPSSSALFALVSLHVHKKKKKKISLFCILTSHLHFVFTFFSSQECVCGGSTTLQERFCGASSPTRTILWSVITHKNDFCERQPCPTRTTNSRTADLIFTNSHIILPSV